MPGFIIHLAIANQYLKNNKKDIEDKDEFIKGVLAPDLAKDKLKSHYTNSILDNLHVKTYIENEYIADSDFHKGYLLHLISDEIFYHKIYKDTFQYVYGNNMSFYEDYYCLNKKIIKRFGVKFIPDEIKKFAEYHKGKTQYLKYSIVKKYIKKVAKIPVTNQAYEILNNDKIIY